MRYFIVVRELCQGEEVDQVVLLLVDVQLKIVLQDLVDLFCLNIGLRVVGHLEVGLDVE